MNILDLWNQLIANITDEIYRLGKTSPSEVVYPKRPAGHFAISKRTNPRRDVELRLDKESGVVNCRSGGPIDGGRSHYPDSKLFKLEPTGIEDIVEWVTPRIFDDFYRLC